MIYRNCRRVFTHRAIVSLSTLLGFAVASPTLHAQSAGSAPITYVYVRGASDTIGVEVVSRSAVAVTGVLSLVGQPRVEWTQSIAPGTLGTLAMKVFAPGGAANAAPVQTGTIDVRGDSAYVDFIGGTQRMKQAIPSKNNAHAVVNASVLHTTLLAAYARAASLSALNVFLSAGAQTIPATIAQAGDTTVFKMGGAELRIVLGTDALPATAIAVGQNVRVMRAKGAVTLRTAEAVRVSYDAPADAPYTAQTVRIPTGRGYELVGTLTKPKGIDKAPVFVTITGSGLQDRDERVPTILPGYAMFREIADTLGRRGVAVLRIDDRGTGESGGRESLTTATSADFADDIRSAIAFLRTRADVDVKHIGLIGHSEGGMIAPMIASTDPQIHAIALLAGTAYTGRRVIMFQNRQSIDQAPGLTTAQRDSLWKTVSPGLDSVAKVNPWMGFFLTHDPVKVARTVKQPVLILQGNTDFQVTAEQADTLLAAFKAGGNRSVTMQRFPNMNHLFLNDPSGQPSGYAALKDSKLRRDALGALVDWAVTVMK